MCIDYASDRCGNTCQEEINWWAQLPSMGTSQKIVIEWWLVRVMYPAINKGNVQSHVTHEVSLTGALHTLHGDVPLHGWSSPDNFSTFEHAKHAWYGMLTTQSTHGIAYHLWTVNLHPSDLKTLLLGQCQDITGVRNGCNFEWLAMGGISCTAVIPHQSYIYWQRRKAVIQDVDILLMHFITVTGIHHNALLHQQMHN